MRQAFVRALQNTKWYSARQSISLRILVWEAGATGLSLETFASKVEPKGGSGSRLAVDDVH
jgi:hypothetical protein